MASQKFRPGVRLRARTQFLEVQNTGRRVVARYLTMLGRPNGGAEDRLGIIASRRLGGAVDRNRAKRRIREVFRRQRSTGGPASGQPALDLVVIARPGIVDAPFGDVTADFQTALRKLRGSR